MIFLKILFFLILLELVVVSYQDIKKKVISHFYPIINLMISILLYLFHDQYMIAQFSFLLYPLGFFILGFFLFQANIMGGGDSKLITSLFLLLPEKHHQVFLENLLVLTLLVSSIILLQRFLKGMKKSRYSYAPVVLLAWIFTGKAIWF